MAALFHQCNRWWIRWLIGAHLTVWNAAATAAALDGMRWIIVVDFHVFTYHNTRFMSQWPFNGRLLVQCGGKSVDLSLPFFLYRIKFLFLIIHIVYCTVTCWLLGLDGVRVLDDSTWRRLQKFPTPLIRGCVDLAANRFPWPWSSQQIDHFQRF